MDQLKTEHVCSVNMWPGLQQQIMDDATACVVTSLDSVH